MEFSEAPSPVSAGGSSSVILERDPVTGEVLEIEGDITELLGLHPSDLTTATALIDRVHADDRPHVAPATGDSDTLLYRLRHADGSHVWVSEQLASINETGVVLSQLQVIESTVRHAQLQETVSRLSDAVAIYELGDDGPNSSTRSLLVVAANDAGIEVLGHPGDTVQVGDLPEFNLPEDNSPEESDFVALLADVIITGSPVALVVHDEDDGYPSTISVERLDQTTAVLMQRAYVELEGTANTSSALAGALTETGGVETTEDSKGQSDSVALSGLLQLLGDNPNPLEILNGLAEHFASECSTWAVDVDAGTAERTRCDAAAELPEFIELSKAALERLSDLDLPVTHPDPAVVALQRRLGSRTPADGTHLAVAPLPSGEIFLAERSETWDTSSLEQFGLVAGLANVATEASAAAIVDDSAAVAGQIDELLQRERFIGSITRGLLAATAGTFDTVISELRTELHQRFDVSDIELWMHSDHTDATLCGGRWTTNGTVKDTIDSTIDSTIDRARWVHAVPCDGTTGFCGAVRFVSGDAQWDTDTLQALDAVAELIWEVHSRIQSERRLAGAFLHAPVAVTVLDPGGIVTSCNDKYADFLGFENTNELVGTPLTRHATIDGRQQIEHLLASTSDATADVPFRRSDENIVWGRVRVSAPAAEEQPASQDAADISSIVHIEDVTENILKQRALEYRVEHDDLTLLATRQRLTTALAEVTKSRDTDSSSVGTSHRDASGHRATLLLIDLDTFETTRSRYGRDQADQVLRVVADRLRTLVRPADLVARTGPAEFGILLHGDESDASALAERLLSSITEPVLVRNTEISATANIGITAILDTDQVSSVLRKADNALDAAKGAGRLRTATFDTALFEQLERDERLEADLADAISSGQIAMHYQPEVSLRTGELLSFEALARWDHPEFGMLDSIEFVAHAERIGLIRDIDELALAEACQQMELWQRQYPGRVRSIRVNISGSSVRSTSYVEHIRTTVAAYNITPDTLWFEISEDELLQDGEAPLEQLEAIKTIGCNILIDDFGHGLSSFAVLRRLPVDALEIAPALIGALGADPDASTIVAATIQLAQTLGLECVAEGVENVTQVMELIELGCQRAHGFLFGEATKAEELSELINEGRINIYDANEG